MTSLIAAVLLAGALLPQPQTTDADARGEELLHIYHQIQARHPDPFFGTPEAAFEAALDELFERIPVLSQEEYLVELMRFVGLISREGRDGHTGLFTSRAFRHLPLLLYRFSDGWFVVAARDESWVGARLLRVAGVPVEEACRRLMPLVTKDNDLSALPRLAGLLILPGVLRAVGIGAAEGGGESIELTLATPGGETRVVRPETLSRDEHRAWSGAPVAGLPVIPGARWLSNPRATWWTEVLAEPRALYVQYNAVLARAQDGSTLGELAGEIVRLFDEHALERVVIDLRLNGGGSNGTYPPLIAALRQHERLNVKGRLFALIGRHTFSAAGNFTTVFQRDLNSILVGEGTGGAPNQYGDAQTVPLLHHPDVLLRISTIHHVIGGAQDLRLTHAPDLPVGMTGAEYFAGEDPALEVALRYQSGAAEPDAR